MLPFICAKQGKDKSVNLLIMECAHTPFLLFYLPKRPLICFSVAQMTNTNTKLQQRAEDRS